MKSQSLKLFAIAFVLGLATIFASASSAHAQTLLFNTTFDFHVGKDKLSAGKYEVQKLSVNRYLLRNTETKFARIVIFDITKNNPSASESERLVFNRYGKTYFLRGIFDKRDADGRQISESKFEKQIRTGAANGEDQLAGEDEKKKPSMVEVKLSK